MIQKIKKKWRKIYLMTSIYLVFSVKHVKFYTKWNEPSYSQSETEAYLNHFIRKYESWEGEMC
jgi:hypothetical protein